MIRLKQEVHQIFSIEPATPLSRRIHSALGLLIILNLVALVLESVPSLQRDYSNFFWLFEIFSIIVFSVEYLLRLWVSDLDGGRWKFVRSPMAIIDLLAIVPAFLPLIRLDLRFLRVMRLLRLLRIFKLARYNHAIQNFIHVAGEKRHELVVAASLGLLLLTLSSCLMYFCENEAQPDKFPSIPHAMWYSVATLTTVGYGDVYPITPLGKFFGAVTAFLGVGMFALPAAILASGFSESLKAEEKTSVKRCPHCHREL